MISVGFVICLTERIKFLLNSIFFVSILKLLNFKFCLMFNILYSWVYSFSGNFVSMVDSLRFCGIFWFIILYLMGYKLVFWIFGWRFLRCFLEDFLFMLLGFRFIDCILFLVWLMLDFNFIVFFWYFVIEKSLFIYVFFMIVLNGWLIKLRLVV